MIYVYTLKYWHKLKLEFVFDIRGVRFGVFGTNNNGRDSLNIFFGVFGLRLTDVMFYRRLNECWQCGLVFKSLTHEQAGCGVVECPKCRIKSAVWLEWLPSDE